MYVMNLRMIELTLSVTVKTAENGVIVSNKCITALKWDWTPLISGRIRIPKGSNIFWLNFWFIYLSYSIRFYRVLFSSFAFCNCIACYFIFVSNYAI